MKTFHIALLYKTCNNIHTMNVKWQHKSQTRKFQEDNTYEKNSCFSYVWPGLLLAYQCWH